MATYTDKYNLKMPSGTDAPNVEDFNENAQIIDKTLYAHANNFADKYDPDSTYTQGKLCIQNDALWKAKQDIDVAEAWTPAHWDATTIAAELSAVNSSLQDIVKVELEEHERVSSGVTLTAKNIDGYRFLAWVSADVIGATTFAIIGSATSQSSQFFFGVDTPVMLRACALYIEDFT